MYRPSEVKTAFAAVDEGIEGFNRVLADTLRRAGYEVTDDARCDVHLFRKLYFETEGRQARHGTIGQGEIVRAIFYVHDTRGKEIDRFELRGAETPERLAVEVVNAMLQSPKLGSYADARKKSGAEPTAPAAGATD
jgi:hypothetical protein